MKPQISSLRLKHPRRYYKKMLEVSTVTSQKRKRHYKKDTKFLLDLYTLTFDNHETLQSLDELVSITSFKKFLGKTATCTVQPNSSCRTCFVFKRPGATVSFSLENTASYRLRRKNSLNSTMC